MKQVPYKTSTGVRIGSRYNESPKPMPIEDGDMLTIQSILICPPEWHKKRRIERIALAISTITFVLVLCAYILVSK
jgi:hypothetical protein